MSANWKIEQINGLIVREEKPKHRDKFKLGRELYRKVSEKIFSRDVSVGEVAEMFVEGHRGLYESFPELFPEFSNSSIMYHHKNGIVAEKLKDRIVGNIIDGPDYLLAVLNGATSDIDRVNYSVSVRDGSCPRDNKMYNSNVLVAQLGSWDKFCLCPKKEDKICGATGRSSISFGLRD